MDYGGASLFSLPAEGSGSEGGLFAEPASGAVAGLRCEHEVTQGISACAAAEQSKQAGCGGLEGGAQTHVHPTGRPAEARGEGAAAGSDGGGDRDGGGGDGVGGSAQRGAPGAAGDAGGAANLPKGSECTGIVDDEEGEMAAYLRSLGAATQPDLELDSSSLRAMDALFGELVSAVMSKAQALAAENASPCARGLGIPGGKPRIGRKSKDGPKTVITSLEVQRAVKAVLPGSGERPEADGKRVPLRPPPLPAVVKRARQMDKASIKGLKSREKRRHNDAADAAVAAGALAGLASGSGDRGGGKSASE